MVNVDIRDSKGRSELSSRIWGYPATAKNKKRVRGTRRVARHLDQPMNEIHAQIMLQNKEYKKKFDDYLGSRLKSVEVNHAADATSAFKPFHSLLK
jgi:hypothetical protein